MKSNKNRELKIRNRPVARVTFLVSASLIAAALLIGFVSYKFSFRMLEESYQSFYLDKAEMIVKASEPYLNHPDGDFLKAIHEYWQAAADKPTDEYICVVDEKGDLLLHSADPSTVGTYAGDNLILGGPDVIEKKLNDLVQSQKPYVGEYISSAGDEQIAAFIAIPGKKWMLGVHRSYQILHKEIEKGFRSLLIGFLFVCGLLMPISLFLIFKTYSSVQKKQIDAERDLKESEKKYKSLVDTMPQCLYRTDLQGRLIFANKSFLEWMGLSLQECIGKSAYHFSSKELARQYLAQDVEAIRTGKTLNTTIEYQSPITKNMVFIEMVRHAVASPENEIVGLQGIFWDVTDKKLAEEKLKYTKAQLEAVLRSVPSGIVAVDTKGLFTIVNQKAEELLGFSQKEGLGHPIKQFIPDAGLPDVLTKGNTEFGKPFSWKSRSLMVSRSPIFEGGKTIGAVSVIQDESELESVQKQLEKLKRVNDELSSLIQNSHDGVLITDTDTVLTVNPSFGRITSLAPSAIEGKAISGLDSEKHLCLAIVQDVCKYVKSHQSSVTMRRKLKSGNEIFVTGTPIFDKSGQVVRLVMNIRDVTELHSLEERIKKITAPRSGLNHDKDSSPEVAFGIVAESHLTRNLLDLAIRIAQVDSTVLLSGESGVGKDVFANLIHNLSKRHDKPLVAVNCGAIPGNLLESELFGYEKGAFSGAGSQGKPGLFEEARGGTVFLDEVGELPLDLQVKLLKVIQEQRCRRLGSVKEIELNIRILAATNRDLKEMVGAGTFREDLFYRLYVVPMGIPPLRERREDILPLALKFLKTYSQKYEVSRTLGQELLQALETYEWPGNIRELQNVIERMVVTADAEMLEPHHLPKSMYKKGFSPQQINMRVPEGMLLREARDQLEKQLIQKALAKTNNIREAAKLLGVAHSTVVRKAQKYGLQLTRDSTLP